MACSVSVKYDYLDSPNKVMIGDLEYEIVRDENNNISDLKIKYKNNDGKKVIDFHEVLLNTIPFFKDEESIEAYKVTYQKKNPNLSNEEIEEHINYLKALVKIEQQKKNIIRQITYQEKNYLFVLSNSFNYPTLDKEDRERIIFLISMTFNGQGTFKGVKYDIVNNISEYAKQFYLVRTKLNLALDDNLNTLFNIFNNKIYSYILQGNPDVTDSMPELKNKDSLLLSTFNSLPIPAISENPIDKKKPENTGLIHSIKQKISEIYSAIKYFANTIKKDVFSNRFDEFVKAINNLDEEGIYEDIFSLLYVVKNEISNSLYFSSDLVDLYVNNNIDVVYDKIYKDFELEKEEEIKSLRKETNEVIEHIIGFGNSLNDKNANINRLSKISKYDVLKKLKNIKYNSLARGNYKLEKIVNDKVTNSINSKLTFGEKLLAILNSPNPIFINGKKIDNKYINQLIKDYANVIYRQKKNIKELGDDKIILEMSSVLSELIMANDYEAEKLYLAIIDASNKIASVMLLQELVRYTNGEDSVPINYLTELSYEISQSDNKKLTIEKIKSRNPLYAKLIDKFFNDDNIINYGTQLHETFTSVNKFLKNEIDENNNISNVLSNIDSFEQVYKAYEQYNELICGNDTLLNKNNINDKISNNPNNPQTLIKAKTLLNFYSKILDKVTTTIINSPILSTNLGDKEVTLQQTFIDSVNLLNNIISGIDTKLNEHITDDELIQKLKVILNKLNSDFANILSTSKIIILRNLEKLKYLETIPEANVDERTYNRFILDLDHSYNKIINLLSRFDVSLEINTAFIQNFSDTLEEYLSYVEIYDFITGKDDNIEQQRKNNTDLILFANFLKLNNFAGINKDISNNDKLYHFNTYLLSNFTIDPSYVSKIFGIENKSLNENLSDTEKLELATEFNNEIENKTKLLLDDLTLLIGDVNELNLLSVTDFNTFVTKLLSLSKTKQEKLLKALEIFINLKPIESVGKERIKVNNAIIESAKTIYEIVSRYKPLTNKDHKIVEEIIKETALREEIENSTVILSTEKKTTRNLPDISLDKKQTEETKTEQITETKEEIKEEIKTETKEVLETNTTNIISTEENNLSGSITTQTEIKNDVDVIEVSQPEIKEEATEKNKLSDEELKKVLDEIDKPNTTELNTTKEQENKTELEKKSFKFSTTQLDYTKEELDIINKAKEQEKTKIDEQQDKPKKFSTKDLDYTEEELDIINKAQQKNKEENKLDTTNNQTININEENKSEEKKKSFKFSTTQLDYTEEELDIINKVKVSDKNQTETKKEKPILLNSQLEKYIFDYIDIIQQKYSPSNNPYSFSFQTITNPDALLELLRLKDNVNEFIKLLQNKNIIDKNIDTKEYIDIINNFLKDSFQYVSAYVNNFVKYRLQNIINKNESKNNLFNTINNYFKYYEFYLYKTYIQSNNIDLNKNLSASESEIVFDIINFISNKIYKNLTNPNSTNSLYEIKEILSNENTINDIINFYSVENKKIDKEALINILNSNKDLITLLSTMRLSIHNSVDIMQSKAYYGLNAKEYLDNVINKIKENIINNDKIDNISYDNIFKLFNYKYSSKKVGIDDILSYNIISNLIVNILIKNPQLDINLSLDIDKDYSDIFGNIDKEEYKDLIIISELIRSFSDIETNEYIVNQKTPNSYSPFIFINNRLVFSNAKNNPAFKTINIYNHIFNILNHFYGKNIKENKKYIETGVLMSQSFNNFLINNEIEFNFGGSKYNYKFENTDNKVINNVHFDPIGTTKQRLLRPLITGEKSNVKVQLKLGLSELNAKERNIIKQTKNGYEIDEDFHNLFVQGFAMLDVEFNGKKIEYEYAPNTKLEQSDNIFNIEDTVVTYKLDNNYIMRIVKTKSSNGYSNVEIVFYKIDNTSEIPNNKERLIEVKNKEELDKLRNSLNITVPIFALQDVEKNENGDNYLFEIVNNTNVSLYLNQYRQDLKSGKEVVIEVSSDSLVEDTYLSMIKSKRPNNIVGKKELLENEGIEYSEKEYNNFENQRLNNKVGNKNEDELVEQVSVNLFKEKELSQTISNFNFNIPYFSVNDTKKVQSIYLMYDKVKPTRYTNYGIGISVALGLPLKKDGKVVDVKSIKKELFDAIKSGNKVLIDKKFKELDTIYRDTEYSVDIDDKLTYKDKDFFGIQLLPLVTPKTENIFDDYLNFTKLSEEKLNNIFIISYLHLNKRLLEFGLNSQKIFTNKELGIKLGKDIYIDKSFIENLNSNNIDEYLGGDLTLGENGTLNKIIDEALLYYKINDTDNKIKNSLINKLKEKLIEGLKENVNSIIDIKNNGIKDVLLFGDNLSKKMLSIKTINSKLPIYYNKKDSEYKYRETIVKDYNYINSYFMKEEEGSFQSRYRFASYMDSNLIDTNYNYYSGAQKMLELNELKYNIDVMIGRNATDSSRYLLSFDNNVNSRKIPARGFDINPLKKFIETINLETFNEDIVNSNNKNYKSLKLILDKLKYILDNLKNDKENFKIKDLNLISNKKYNENENIDTIINNLDYVELLNILKVINNKVRTVLKEKDTDVNLGFIDLTYPHGTDVNNNALKNIIFNLFILPNTSSYYDSINNQLYPSYENKNNKPLMKLKYEKVEIKEVDTNINKEGQPISEEQIDNEEVINEKIEEIVDTTKEDLQPQIELNKTSFNNINTSYKFFLNKNNLSSKNRGLNFLYAQTNEKEKSNVLLISELLEQLSNETQELGISKSELFTNIINTLNNNNFGINISTYSEWFNIKYDNNLENKDLQNRIEEKAKQIIKYYNNIYTITLNNQLNELSLLETSIKQAISDIKTNDIDNVKLNSLLSLRNENNKEFFDLFVSQIINDKTYLDYDTSKLIYEELKKNSNNFVVFNRKDSNKPKIEEEETKTESISNELVSDEELLKENENVPSYVAKTPLDKVNQIVHSFFKENNFLDTLELDNLLEIKGSDILDVIENNKPLKRNNTEILSTNSVIDEILFSLINSLKENNDIDSLYLLEYNDFINDLYNSIISVLEDLSDVTIKKEWANVLLSIKYLKEKTDEYIEKRDSDKNIKIEYEKNILPIIEAIKNQDIVFYDTDDLQEGNENNHYYRIVNNELSKSRRDKGENSKIKFTINPNNRINNISYPSAFTDSVVAINKTIGSIIDIKEKPFILSRNIYQNINSSLPNEVSECEIVERMYLYYQYVRLSEKNPKKYPQRVYYSTLNTSTSDTAYTIKYVYDNGNKLPPSTAVLYEANDILYFIHSLELIDENGVIKRVFTENDPQYKKIKKLKQNYHYIEKVNEKGEKYLELTNEFFNPKFNKDILFYSNKANVNIKKEFIKYINSKNEQELIRVINEYLNDSSINKDFIVFLINDSIKSSNLKQTEKNILINKLKSLLNIDNIGNKINDYYSGAEEFLLFEQESPSSNNLKLTELGKKLFNKYNNGEVLYDKNDPEINKLDFVKKLNTLKFINGLLSNNDKFQNAVIKKVFIESTNKELQIDNSYSTKLVIIKKINELINYVENYSTEENIDDMLSYIDNMIETKFLKNKTTFKSNLDKSIQKKLEEIFNYEFDNEIEQNIFNKLLSKEVNINNFDLNLTTLLDYMTHNSVLSNLSYLGTGDLNIKLYKKGKPIAFSYSDIGKRLQQHYTSGQPISLSQSIISENNLSVNNKIKRLVVISAKNVDLNKKDGKYLVNGFNSNDGQADMLIDEFLALMAGKGLIDISKLSNIKNNVYNYTNYSSMYIVETIMNLLYGSDFVLELYELISKKTRYSNENDIKNFINNNKKISNKFEELSVINDLIYEIINSGKENSALLEKLNNQLKELGFKEDKIKKVNGLIKEKLDIIQSKNVKLNSNKNNEGLINNIYTLSVLKNYINNKKLGAYGNTNIYYNDNTIIKFQHFSLKCSFGVIIPALVEVSDNELYKSVIEHNKRELENNSDNFITIIASEDAIKRYSNDDLVIKENKKIDNIADYSIGFDGFIVRDMIDGKPSYKNTTTPIGSKSPQIISFFNKENEKIKFNTTQKNNISKILNPKLHKTINNLLNNKLDAKSIGNAVNNITYLMSYKLYKSKLKKLGLETYELNYSKFIEKIINLSKDVELDENSQKVLEDYRKYESFYLLSNDIINEKIKNTQNKLIDGIPLYLYVSKNYKLFKKAIDELLSSEEINEEIIIKTFKNIEDKIKKESDTEEKVAKKKTQEEGSEETTEKEIDFDNRDKNTNEAIKQIMTLLSDIKQELIYKYKHSGLNELNERIETDILNLPIYENLKNGLINQLIKSSIHMEVNGGFEVNYSMAHAIQYKNQMYFDIDFIKDVLSDIGFKFNENTSEQELREKFNSISSEELYKIICDNKDNKYTDIIFASPDMRARKNKDGTYSTLKDLSLEGNIKGIVGMTIRIPQAGRETSSPMRIVGVLPDGFSGCASSHPYTVWHKGEDFDFDKLAMQISYQYKDKDLEKISELINLALENNIYDIETKADEIIKELDDDLMMSVYAIMAYISTNNENHFEAVQEGTNYGVFQTKAEEEYSKLGLINKEKSFDHVSQLYSEALVAGSGLGISVLISSMISKTFLQYSVQNNILLHNDIIKILRSLSFLFEKNYKLSKDETTLNTLFKEFISDSNFNAINTLIQVCVDAQKLLAHSALNMTKDAYNLYVYLIVNKFLAQSYKENYTNNKGDIKSDDMVNMLLYFNNSKFFINTYNYLDGEESIQNTDILVLNENGKKELFPKLVYNYYEVKKSIIGKPNEKAGIETVKEISDFIVNIPYILSDDVIEFNDGTIIIKDIKKLKQKIIEKYPQYKNIDDTKLSDEIYKMITGIFILKNKVQEFNDIFNDYNNRRPNTIKQTIIKLMTDDITKNYNPTTYDMLMFNEIKTNPIINKFIYPVINIAKKYLDKGQYLLEDYKFKEKVYDSILMLNGYKMVKNYLPTEYLGVKNPLSYITGSFLNSTNLNKFYDKLLNKKIVINNKSYTLSEYLEIIDNKLEKVYSKEIGKKDKLFLSLKIEKGSHNILSFNRNKFTKEDHALFNNMLEEILADDSFFESVAKDLSLNKNVENIQEMKEYLKRMVVTQLYISQPTNISIYNYNTLFKEPNVESNEDKQIFDNIFLQQMMEQLFYKKKYKFFVPINENENENEKIASHFSVVFKNLNIPIYINENHFNFKGDEVGFKSPTSGNMKIGTETINPITFNKYKNNQLEKNINNFNKNNYKDKINSTYDLMIDIVNNIKDEEKKEYYKQLISTLYDKTMSLDFGFKIKISKKDNVCRYVFKDNEAEIQISKNVIEENPELFLEEIIHALTYKLYSTNILDNDFKTMKNNIINNIKNIIPKTLIDNIDYFIENIKDINLDLLDYNYYMNSNYNVEGIENPESFKEFYVYLVNYLARINGITYVTPQIYYDISNNINKLFYGLSNINEFIPNAIQSTKYCSSFFKDSGFTIAIGQNNQDKIIMNKSLTDVRKGNIKNHILRFINRTLNNNVMDNIYEFRKAKDIVPC